MFAVFIVSAVPVRQNFDFPPAFAGAKVVGGQADGENLIA